MEILQHPSQTKPAAAEVVGGLKPSYPPSEAWSACNNTDRFWLCQLCNHLTKLILLAGRQYGPANRTGQGIRQSHFLSATGLHYEVEGTPESCTYCLCTWMNRAKRSESSRLEEFWPKMHGRSSLCINTQSKASICASVLQNYWMSQTITKTKSF